MLRHKDSYICMGIARASFHPCTPILVPTNMPSTAKHQQFADTSTTNVCNLLIFC